MPCKLLFKNCSALTSYMTSSIFHHFYLYSHGYGQYFPWSNFKKKDILVFSSLSSFRLGLSPYRLGKKGAPYSDKFILRNSFLRSLSWTVGSLATLFNGFNIVTSAYDIREVDTFAGLMNKCFILLISLGDLLMGVYLVLIAYADLHFGNSYCQERNVWLSSTECSLLGILSTIATQLSLFSMTALSIFRIRTVSMIIQRSISARSIMDMILIILTILALSAAVACIPVITVLEDFFVNGLYYHKNPLFTGSVGKDQHYDIFRGYYGYFKSSGLTWSTIRFIVTDLFTSEYGGS